MRGRTIRNELRRRTRTTRAMMSASRPLFHRWVAALVIVGLVSLVSGSSARANPIVGGDLNPSGVAVEVDQSGDVTAAPVHASLTYPTAGQTNVSTLTPFSWAGIPAAQGYQLYIGTAHHGDGSLLKSGLLSAKYDDLQSAGAPDRGDAVGTSVHGSRGELGTTIRTSRSW